MSIRRGAPGRLVGTRWNVAHPTFEPPAAGEGIQTPWSRSERPFPRAILQPLQAFLETGAASGLLLLAAAAAALVWANSPWRESYGQVWRTDLFLRVGRWVVGEDLRGWIDDGLMALFFLVAGLEIKRELLTGELRDRRTAVLPVVAALGGMLVPALIYLAFTVGSEAARGWGMAMPTDLVFALGVLALGGGAPAGLKAFLLALAIVDDLGSLLVIALFYSRNVDWEFLGIVAALCAGIVLLQQIHVRSAAVYVTMGVGVWLAFHAAGVSGTVAGVTVGFLTPSVPFQRPKAVSQEAHRVADETVDNPFPPDADAGQWLYLARLSRETVSPLARTEALLLSWTSYLVVPLFALANAGVVLSGHALASTTTSRLATGMVVARVVGKTAGISLACLLAVRTRIARLPVDTSWWHIVGVGMAAGVPFTVSLLVAELGLPAGALLHAAKLGILVAALVAGVLGFVLIRFASARHAGAGRLSDHDAQG
jgi:NhaA family Na+:H+ antiporter